MEFLSWLPASVIGIITLPLIILYYFRKKKQASILFSSLSFFEGIRPSVKFRLRHIPFFIFILAYISLLVAFSRPRLGHELKRDYKEGIAIQIILDRSSSMVKSPIQTENNKVVTYFELNKNVAKNFILGNEELPGRPSDIIGFSSFAAFVEENCPLTLDHKNLTRIIDTVKTVVFQSEDGTAIGDAIYFSVLNLITIDEYILFDNEDYTIKSKIIILLTDGLNNTGRDVKSASEFAKDNNIKLYPIMYANQGLQKAINAGDAFVLKHINELEDSAEKTNGKFFLIRSSRELNNIYKEIDELEKSKLEEASLRYTELFPYFIIAALVLLLLEIMLSQTIFKRIP